MDLPLNGITYSVRKRILSKISTDTMAISTDTMAISTDAMAIRKDDMSADAMRKGDADAESGIGKFAQTSIVAVPGVFRRREGMMPSSLPAETPLANHGEVHGRDS